MQNCVKGVAPGWCRGTEKAGVWQRNEIVHFLCATLYISHTAECCATDIRIIIIIIKRILLARQPKITSRTLFKVKIQNKIRCAYTEPNTPEWV